MSNQLSDEEIAKYLRDVASFQYDVIDKTTLILQLNQLQVSLFQIADALSDRVKQDTTHKECDHQ